MSYLKSRRNWNAVNEDEYLDTRANTIEKEKLGDSYYVCKYFMPASIRALAESLQEQLWRANVPAGTKWSSILPIPLGLFDRL